MIINETVHFKANKAQVWDLLTNPAKTQQYMFGSEVVSTWKVGDLVEWKGKTEAGEAITFVKGEVIVYEAGSTITQTMFDPHMGLEDVPENYAKLTYSLSESNEGTTLQIIQDFTGVGLAQKRFEESQKGWPMVIQAMKEMLA
ncbi:MAG TPA: hypothetical protein DCS93_22025 [Microscillaceae bacterium]|nr:hypothetical protein [Microscillaceae bacterium]